MLENVENVANLANMAKMIILATFTNKTKHKAMRGPIDVGECGEQKLMNKNLISSAVQTFDIKLEMFISGILMI